MNVPTWAWWLLLFISASGWVAAVINGLKAAREGQERQYWVNRWSRLMDYHDDIWDLLCDPNTPREVLEEKMRKLP